jgi:hypothetical protein
MLKNIIKKHFSERDTADMALFANLITPPTWNVFVHEEDRIIRPTFLNIKLCILTEAEMNEDKRTEDAMGFVPAVAGYIKISQYVDTLRENLAEESCKELDLLYNQLGFETSQKEYEDWNDVLKRFGDGTVASAQLILCPYRGDWKGTIVHELAHIAEPRLEAQKKKLSANALIFPSESKEHGPLFLKALARMINRAEAVFSSGRSWTIFRMWNSFASYAFKLKKAGVPHNELPLHLLPKWAAMILVYAEDAGFREFLLSFLRES